MSPYRSGQFQAAASALTLLSVLALAGCNPAPNPDKAAASPEASPVAASTAPIAPAANPQNPAPTGATTATAVPAVATSTADAKPIVQTPPAAATKPAASVPSPPAAQPPVVTAGLPAGPGREVVQKACGSCHGIDTVTAVGRTPQQWAEIIGQMQNMGLSASDEDLATIHAYLSRQLPPK